MPSVLRKTTCILAALALVCSCSRSSVIPRGTFSKIYADMLLTEAWLRSDIERQHATDTMWVYEAIFNKYGYTTEDYWASVDYYMLDPDKYSRILDKAADRLEEGSRYVEAEKVWTDAMESYRHLMEKRTRPLYFAYDSLFIDRLAPWKSPGVRLDTAINVYLPEYDERRDSVRTDIQPETGELLRHQSAATEGQALQF